MSRNSGNRCRGWTNARCNAIWATFLLRCDAISAGTSQYRMQTFDQSLWDLFQARHNNYEVALENASNADDFKLRMQGIASTADISRQAMQTSGYGR